jgi:histidinol-phosphate aminotransferase
MHSYLQGKSSYDLPFTPAIKHKLDIVETLFPACPQVLEAARAAITDLHRYPSREDLEELATRTMGYCGDTTLKPLFTAGSDSALKLIIDTYFTKGADIAVVTPTYPHFIQMAECTPSRVRQIECRSEEDILKRMDEFAGAKVIYLCTPNLPLGYTARGALGQILERYPEAIVIVDEAYAEYQEICSGELTRSDIPHLPPVYPNLIVTRTFSKFFGLAALRLGYLIAHPTRRAELAIVHNGKTVSRVAAVAGVAALRNLEHFDRNLREFVVAREYLRTELPRVVSPDCQVTDFNLQGGNFFLIYARDTVAVTRAFASLASVAVRDKSSEIRNASGHGAIRISIAPIPVMRMVVRVIRHINGYPGVYWLADLDGTLRPGSKLMDPVDPGVTTFLNTQPVTVVTNNTMHTIEEIRRQLGAPAIPVIQPSAPEGYFQIARGADNSQEPDGGWRGVAVMNSVLDAGSEAWARAAELIARGLPVAVVETTWNTPLRLSSECTSCAWGLLPDAGAVLDAAGVQSWEIIGKPNLWVPRTERTVVVGDSDTDRELAKQIGAEFVLVDPYITRVEIDEQETRVPSVTALTGVHQSVQALPNEHARHVPSEFEHTTEVVEDLLVSFKSNGDAN